MKPDRVACQYCGKELDGKANKKFCSDAHRMAFVRVKGSKANKPEHLPEQMEPEQQIEGVEKHGEIQFDVNPNKLTKTDKTFYARAMRDFGEPYYRFGEKIHEEVCKFCDKGFRTSLSLLAYCCYNHYRDSLAGKK